MTAVDVQLWQQSNAKKKQYDVIFVTIKAAVQRDKKDLAEETRMIDYAIKEKLRNTDKQG